MVCLMTSYCGRVEEIIVIGVPSIVQCGIMHLNIIHVDLSNLYDVLMITMVYNCLACMLYGYSNLGEFSR